MLAVSTAELRLLSGMEVKVVTPGRAEMRCKPRAARDCQS